MEELHKVQISCQTSLASSAQLSAAAALKCADHRKRPKKRHTNQSYWICCHLRGHSAPLWYPRSIVQAFLSLPAADDSAYAEGGHSPPAAPGHNLGVDLRQPNKASPAMVGRPRGRGAPKAALVGSPTPPLPPAQIGGGLDDGAGLPLLPPPSAPVAPVRQADSPATASWPATGIRLSIGLFFSAQGIESARYAINTS